ncbi:MAG: bifunctional precorrin-2 dehydrogenase/sirohydrochlorin ferrochelatase [Thermodesulfobacteriota bacterium]
MRYYPVFLDLRGRPAVVIGGGAVAERKVGGLLAAGASVTVISPRASKGIEALAAGKRIRLVGRAYREGMLEGAFIAVCATGSKAANEAARREADKRGVLLNVVDDRERCDFIVPSVVDRGSLVIAISTSGCSPLFARKMREGVEQAVGEEYAVFVEILGAVRKKLLKRNTNNVKKKRVFKELVNSPIPGWLAAGVVKEVNGFLKDLLGDGYTLSGLGIRSKPLKKQP